MIAPTLAAVLSVKRESADEWMDRFVKHRTGKVTTVDRDHSQWLKHISPVSVRGGATTFGKLAMVSITADDVEAVRDHLDSQIDAWEASGKKRGVGLAFASGANVWSILVCAMKHASTRKGDRVMRVREAQGNPTAGIRPPRVGRGKRRHWLRSSWINAALASPKNDTAIKEAVCIAVGLHLRPGELHELRVRDLDFEAGEVRIERAYDENTGKVGSTKTDEGVRTVTIPTWLLPLLQRIASERRPNDHVAPWVEATSEHDRPEAFRSFLRSGGAAPEHIFEDSPTHEMVDFRTTRDTGITLRFLANERAEVIQREAGHEQISTTLGYAKEVANRGGRYGDPFLTVPRELCARSTGGALASAAISSEPVPELERMNPPKYPEPLGNSVARVGFEPTTFGL